MAQVIDRGPGRWLVRVFLGRDPKGKRVYHNKTIRGPKKAATKYATKVQGEVDAGTFGDAQESKETVAEFLDYWLDHTAARKVTEYTLRDYRALAGRYLKPVLGHVVLTRLEPSDVQELVTHLEEKGLSPRTVRYAQGILRNALNKAVREGKIPSNPAAAVLIDLPKSETRELTVLSPEDARAFVAAAREDRWGALWILLLGTGARPGEALGLKWEDFDGTRIRIQRALVRDRSGGGWKLKEPKTKKSRRTVPLPQAAIEALRTHRKRQAEEKLAATEYTDHGFIFADLKGGPLNWGNVTREHFYDIRTQARLPAIRPYDLRHSCASLLLAGGVNPKVVSERLGHSTVVLTLDTYSAVLPGLQEEATAKLDDVLGGA